MMGDRTLLHGVAWVWPLDTSHRTRTERRARRRRLLRELREQRRGQHLDPWAGWQTLGWTTDWTGER